MTNARLRAARPGRPCVQGCAAVVTAALATAGCLVTPGDRRPEIADPVVTTLGGNAEPVHRTIPLELSFVRCAADDALLRDELWQFVDEQWLPAALRSRLAANGLRVGVVARHLPPAIAARFAAPGQAADATPSLPTDAPLSRRLVRLLPGRRGEVITAAGIDELVLLEQEDGRVRGGTFRDASPMFSVEVRPAADGRVLVEVTPEIRHGPLEKSWVGEDGMFRLEAGQRRHRMEHLNFSCTLPAGGMLVIGCDGDENATAGDCLLRDHERGDDAGVRVLAIRPLTDAVDPLFAAPDRDSEADEAPLVVH